MDRSPSPGSLRSHWLGHLPSLASPAHFARSKFFIECYTNISKSLDYIKVCKIKNKSLYKCYVGAVSLDRSFSPGSLRSNWLGHLPSLASPARFACSKGFIECYTNILVFYIKVCDQTRRNTKRGKIPNEAQTRSQRGPLVCMNESHQRDLF